MIPGWFWPQCRPLATLRVPPGASSSPPAGYSRVDTRVGVSPRPPLARRHLGDRDRRDLGAPLLTRLCADGLQVVDVPAKLAARVRLLSSGHGRKNDDDDAISVGIAAMTAAHLNTVQIDEAVAALRALVEHREDLVEQWVVPTLAGIT